MILNDERLDMRYNIRDEICELDDIIFESMGFDAITELAEEYVKDEGMTQEEAEWEALVDLRSRAAEMMSEMGAY